MAWIVVVDLLEIAEHFRRREGEWPSREQVVWEVQKHDFRWAGEDLFFSDFDATEGLCDDSIVDFVKLPEIPNPENP